jgi:hypothetical protein
MIIGNRKHLNSILSLLFFSFFCFYTFAKMSKPVFTLSLWGIVCRLLRIYFYLIIELGCNITMRKKSRGLNTFRGHCQTPPISPNLVRYSLLLKMCFLVNLHTISHNDITISHNDITIPHNDITIPHNDKAKTGF